MQRHNYWQMVDRNIGIITRQQQQRLQDSTVAIFGLGGLGGVAAEALCRTGVGYFKLIEPGEFEPTNLNRQIFCFCSTLNQKKREVTARFLKDINPEAKIEVFEKEDESNIGEILEGVDAVILAVDEVRACIVVSREARKKGIPLVESWAMPYGLIRVFTKETLTLEEAYQLPSIGRQVNDISEEELRKMGVKMIEDTVAKIEGLNSFYSPLVSQRVTEGENPSFAPLVWLNAVLLALETVKVLLQWGNIALAPQFCVYDPIQHRVPNQVSKGW